jgi:ABC-type taurine transport system ATPase subunit
MVLDEPFRFVSAGYRGRIGELLTTLAREMDCQFVIVTHQEEMKIGKVVEL